MRMNITLAWPGVALFVSVMGAGTDPFARDCTSERADTPSAALRICTTDEVSTERQYWRGVPDGSGTIA
jgi:hypothetical protein